MLQRYAPEQELPPTEMLAPADAEKRPSEQTMEAMQANHWRRVAAIAGECVSLSPDQDVSITEADIQYTLAWWHIRFISLSKMILYTQLRKELNALWTVLESVRIWDEKKEDVVPLIQTSLVPFSLHAVYAQQLFLGGFQREGTARLCQLIHMAQSLSKNDDTGQELWHRRNIRLRVLLSSLLIESYQLPAAASVVAELDVALRAKATPDLSTLLMLVRLYLAMGEIQRARITLDEAHKEHTELPPDAAAGLATHEALFHYTIRPHDPYDFPEALHTYEARANHQSLTNTMALGALLRGDIVQSIQLMERILQEHPTIVSSSKALTHNLLTLHSLGTKEYVTHVLTQCYGRERACSALPRLAGRG